MGFARVERLSTTRKAVAAVAVLALLFTATRVRATEDVGPGRRFHDPVVLKTKRLGSLDDPNTAAYRLYARQGDEFLAIPYQFDQWEDGAPVFSDQPGEPAFEVDEDDELVFMAKDAGERGLRRQLPEEADFALEIELRDETTQQSWWAYLLHFDGVPPSRSPVRYASFDPKANRARSPLYEITYAPGRSFFSDVRVRRSDQSLDQPLIDRTRVEINPTFSVTLLSWSPVFTEESFSSTTDGVRNGPVRAIRRLSQSLELGPVFPDAPSGTVYTYFYFSSFWTPSTFSLPALALAALDRFRFSELEDLGPEALGVRYWDGANPEGVAFTGNSRPAKVDEDHEWWAISGGGGSCMHAFLLPQQWLEWGVVRGTSFRDEAPTEAGPGLHAAGFELLHMDRIEEAGDYEMLMASVVLPDGFAPGNERDLLRMLREPLEVAVRVVR